MLTRDGHLAICEECGHGRWVYLLREPDAYACQRHGWRAKVTIQQPKPAPTPPPPKAAPAPHRCGWCGSTEPLSDLGYPGQVDPIYCPDCKGC